MTHTTQRDTAIHVCNRKLDYRLLRTQTQSMTGTNFSFKSSLYSVNSHKILPSPKKRMAGRLLYSTTLYRTLRPSILVQSDLAQHRGLRQTCRAWATTDLLPWVLLQGRLRSRRAQTSPHPRLAFHGQPAPLMAAGTTLGCPRLGRVVFRTRGTSLGVIPCLRTSFLTLERFSMRSSGREEM